MMIQHQFWMYETGSNSARCCKIMLLKRNEMMPTIFYL